MSIDRNTNKFSKKVRGTYNQNSMEKGIKIPAGIYRGVVVNNSDPRRMGRVRVQISAFYGTLTPGLDAAQNIDDEETFPGAQWCRCLLPVTSGTSQVGGDGGQVAYGINGPRPQKDNEVIVAFSGDSAVGIVLGILPDEQKVANTAAGPVARQTSEGTVAVAQEVGKTATSSGERPPPHPQQKALEAQGLGKDRLRGLNFSSIARDPTPNVLGVTTPKGHGLIMDDGAVEDESNLGIRLRSAGGAQILMDDTNGFTYIVNRDGSSWIEMNRNGDIDIYTKQSLNIGTPGSINMTCGGSFNVQAGTSINMQANGATGIKLAAPGGSVDIFAGTNMQLQAEANGNLRCGGNWRETAARIDMNGPAAAAAQKPTVTQIAGNKGITQSIAPRVPEAEPWGGHLDVSVVDPNSASGAASFADSQTYYYGQPANPSSTDTQGGRYDENQFQPSQPGDFLTYTSNVDRRINPKLIALMEDIAREFGRPLTITSGYRDPGYNASVGGAKRSQHMLANAVDISGSGLSNSDRLKLIEIASRKGARGIGVYNGGSMHFDIRSGARAAWGGSYTNASIPSYARTTLDRHTSGGFA